MTKLETLNQEMQRRGVLTTDEIARLAGKVLNRKDLDFRYLFTEYLSKLLDRGLVTRPRRGLYVSTRSSGHQAIADRYVIASKLRSPYYLGLHTALELHGCAYSWFKTVTICLAHGIQFRPFEFQGTRYKPVSTAHPKLGTERITRVGHEVVLSNPSRTFVDCLDRPDLAGGWEEVLKSLGGLPDVKANELLKILKSISKKILYRKVGLVLDLLSSSIYLEGVAGDVWERLQEHTGGQPLYIDRNAPGPLNKRWNIYEVPNMSQMLEGV